MTAVTALTGDVEKVAKGGIGFRLKDKAGFIPSGSDRLIYITDTPVCHRHKSAELRLQ